MGMSKEESNVGSIPELSDFEAVHCAIGKLVILHSSYSDPLAKWCTPTEFPDTTVCIKLADAKRLIAELQRAVDMIDAGIEHPSSRFDH